MRALIAIGSNCEFEGQAIEITVEKSIQALRVSLGESFVVSRFYAASAFPKGSGPDFVNAVVACSTDMPAGDLIESLHQIEDDFARLRPHRWAPRTLDLDLIDYAGHVLPDFEGWSYWADLPLERQQQEAPRQLILPHPRVQDRAFVLKPLLDVAPDWRHPVLGLDVQEMLDPLPSDYRDDVVPLNRSFAN